MAQEPLATKGNFLHIYDFLVKKGHEDEFIRLFEEFDYSDGNPDAQILGPGEGRRALPRHRGPAALLPDRRVGGHRRACAHPQDPRQGDQAGLHQIYRRREVRPEICRGRLVDARRHPQQGAQADRCGTMRRLYTFFRSSTSYRLRIALALKGLDWEPHYVSLPQDGAPRAGLSWTSTRKGLVPALIEDDGACSRRASPSSNISTRPIPIRRSCPAIRSSGPMCAALSQIIGCDIHPLNNVRVLKWLASRWSSARTRSTSGMRTGSPRGCARSRRPSSAQALREILSGRQRHDGRHLPGPADRQCAPLQLSA